MTNINNIKKIRKKVGVTQMQIAEYLQVSNKVVSMWESSKNKEKVPTKRLNQIADFLDVPVNELICENPNLIKIEINHLEKNIEKLKWRLNNLKMTQIKSFQEVRQIGRMANK